MAIRPQGNMRIAHQIIYGLKRTNGFPVVAYRMTRNDNNDETGRSEIDYDTHNISRALVLRGDEARKFSYDLSYIAANKNFTYGAFYDIETRWFIIDEKDMAVDFELNMNDHIAYSNNRYHAVRIFKIPELQATVFIGKMLTSQIPYTAEIEAMIDAGWVADEFVKAALHKLAITIKLDVFNNSVPDNFMLWPCCGDSFDDSLFTVWHPSGAGTKLTNILFTEFEYKNIGALSGLISDGSTMYLDTGYDPSVQATFDDFHIGIFGKDMVQGAAKVLTGSSETPAFAQLSEDGAGDQVGTIGAVGDVVKISPAVETNHILVSSRAANDMEIYEDGVSSAVNTSVRTQALPSRNIFIGADNSAGSGASYSALTFRALTLGGGLTDAQVLTLYNALLAFETTLGRVG